MAAKAVGAFVALKESPATPHDDAHVGLAGPMWGLGAALVAYGRTSIAPIPARTRPGTHRAGTIGAVRAA